MKSGLALNNPESWKYLALLIDILYAIPRSKQIIIKMINAKYATELESLLEFSKDFQQANYLMELLSNCFPRKAVDKLGVVLPPSLWDGDKEKNDRIFNNSFYPFKGKHGDTQVINFILEVLGSKLQNLLCVDEVTYSSTNGAVGAKKFKTKKSSQISTNCYVQAIFDRIYLWDTDGSFLEMNRRHVEVVKSLKGDIQINVRVQSSQYINSPNKLWLPSFAKVKWFQLKANDTSSCETFFHNITSIRKISEVQKFLVLNHLDEELVDDTEEKRDFREDISTSVSVDGELAAQMQDASHVPFSGKNPLATPEQSDAKINTDEWDFNPSSDHHGTTITEKQDAKQVTPEKSNDVPRTASSCCYEDQSPLVIAQKRRMIRETTRTLEILKKDFAIHNNLPSSKGDEAHLKKVERSPSLMITKFETAKINPDIETSGKLTECFVKPNTDKTIKTPKVKVSKSIGTKDIVLLDTIFGSSSGKKPKRQQKLRNFKPVIDVPSQDTPAVKTRGHKRSGPKVSNKAFARISSPKSSKIEINNEQPISGEHEVSSSTEKGPNSKRKEDVLKDEINLPVKKQQKSAPDSVPCLLSHSASDKKLAADNKVSKGPEPKCLSNEEFLIENESNTSLLDSTTVLNPSQLCFNDNAFTDKLQQQIFSSITHFSNELVRKMSIINKELNNKIIKELSEKYQKLFQEIQTSFQSDTEEMFKFMGEIKDMLNLPEDQLILLIRNRKFGQAETKDNHVKS